MLNTTDLILNSNRQSGISATEKHLRVKGGVKSGHWAAQKPASGGVPSAMARALTR